MEFFFHAMSGREGVSDTAMSTAKSGYIQRKIVKVCEDIQVQNDQTVRDATGKIYQFTYGETGYDPIKTIRISGKPSTCDVSRLVDRMNTNFEMGIEEKDEDLGPEIIAEVVAPPGVISAEKQKLIDKIRRKQPNTMIDDDWSVDNLQQRFDAMEINKTDDEDDSTTTIDEQEDEDKDEDAMVKDDDDEDEEEITLDEDEEEFGGYLSDNGNFADE